MGDFGYKPREAVRGEVGTSSINIIRTGIATEEIEFGDLLELSYRTAGEIEAGETGIGVRPYADSGGNNLPVLGVAIYKPYSSDGKQTKFKYEVGDAVQFMVFGDINMFVSTGSLCLMGDTAYLATSGGKWFVTDTPGPRKVGVFAETKEALADNSVLIALDVQVNTQ